MTMASKAAALVRHPDRLFIGGAWVEPSSRERFDVLDSTNEEVFISVAEAKDADVSRAVAAARNAFDSGPWPRMSHAERAEFLRGIADGLRKRSSEIAQVWPREAGELYSNAQAVAGVCADTWDYYADLSASYPFETPVTGSGGEYGVLVREPVGVVGAIIPWNGPLGLITFKLAPALLAGCTLVLKCAPEAPVEGYIVAEIAEEVGLPPGVLNVVTADREASELLVRDPRVDKVAFTGSTVAGRRIASICGERIARCTLELGGKSAAVVLDDADIAHAASTLARAGSLTTGQVCSLLTRIVVSRSRHDELLAAVAEAFGQIRVGDPFDETTEMGPLVSQRQRQRVEGYIAKGKADGATLAVGGGRPKHLQRGYFVEPTVFGNVDNSSTIAREEIFGPVLSVIPADDEAHAVAIANDSIYGLNASVFTKDPDRARAVARELRSGTVAHNRFGTDFGVSFGGFKQSGIGREGGALGVAAYLETKFLILAGPPEGTEGGGHRDDEIASLTFGAWQAGQSRRL